MGYAARVAQDNRGDAVIASLAITKQLRASALVSDEYYQTPARSVTRTGEDIAARPEDYEGRRVAVCCGISA